MNSIYRVHSECSLKHCALKISDIIKQAKELGFTSIALTDDGNMTGAIEFYTKCLSEEINPVIGVDAMIDEGYGVYSHIVFLAINYEGYKKICKLVTETNKNLNSVGNPVLKPEMLSMFFDGTSDDVYAIVSTSDGYPVGHILAAEKKQEEKKVKRKVKKNIYSKEEIKKAKNDFEDIGNDLKKARKDKKILEAKLQMDPENKEIEEQIEKIKSSISVCTKLANSIKRKYDWDAKPETVEVEEEDIDEGRELMLRLSFLHRLFPSRLYIDLSYHKKEIEKKTASMLCDSADFLHLSYVCSNNCYMLGNTDDDILKWHLIQSLMNNEWVEISPYSQYYNMRTEEQLRELLSECFTIEQIDKAVQNTDAVCNSCHLEINKEEHYPKYTPPKGETVKECLEKRCRDNIAELYPEGWDDEHEQRLQYELGVIDKMGYCDYTLTIADMLEAARKKGDQGFTNCVVGPGRGSGAGSLVNRLMKITYIDPIQYDLIFERYLNIERISPPDIDSDIATSIREELVDNIKETYSKVEGKIGVCCILTKSKLTAKAAVRAAGRIMSHRYNGNTTAYFGLTDELSKAMPDEPKLKLASCIDDLRDRFKKEEAREILHYAMLLEEVVWAYSTHAAGVIISDCGDITEYAPLLNIGSNEDPVWNIQYDMVESESIGLLKLDALGLTTLDVNNDTLSLIYRTRGEKIDLFSLPFEKEVFRDIYSKGNTNCVFQCESEGMKKMWMKLKPEGIEDIIAGVALYRPGPMEFIDDYVKGKNDPDSIVYKTEQMRPILEKTYGIIVYQEQVIRIVRDLAGYSMGRGDLVRRAMSKKKQAVMEKERLNFVYGNEKENIKGCINNGIPEDVANSIYDDLIDFAKYAFNKSHSAAYAIVSYQTAWLKYHYPKEFLVSSLNHATPEKIPMILQECRNYRYQIVNPDINLSMSGFTIFEGKVMYGLGSVKGVKKNADKIIESRKNRPDDFFDLESFILYGDYEKGSFQNLIKAGAFDRLCKKRSSLLDNLDQLVEIKKKFKEAEKKRIDHLNKQEILTREDPNSKKIDTEMSYVNRYCTEMNKQRDELQMVIETIKDGAGDTNDFKLDAEKEVLFDYISTHPLDQYKISSKDNTCMIKDVYYNPEKPREKFFIIAYIKEVKVIKRKKDGRSMAVCTLEDASEIIKALCFAGVYENMKDRLKKGVVLKLEVEAMLSDNDQERCVLSLKNIFEAKKKDDPVLVACDSDDYDEFLNIHFYPYLNTDGGSPIIAIVGLGPDKGKLIETKYFFEDGAMEEIKENPSIRSLVRKIHYYKYED